MGTAALDRIRLSITTSILELYAASDDKSRSQRRHSPNRNLYIITLHGESSEIYSSIVLFTYKTNPLNKATIELNFYEVIMTDLALAVKEFHTMRSDIKADKLEVVEKELKRSVV